MSALFETSTPHAGGYREVRPEQVAARASDARIIDVRELNEFYDELAHIDGAELVPLATVAAAARRWRTDESIVLVCRSGRRSEQAARMLVRAGFDHVMNMVGGMLAWNAAGLPVAGRTIDASTR